MPGALILWHKSKSPFIHPLTMADPITLSVGAIAAGPEILYPSQGKPKV